MVSESYSLTKDILLQRQILPFCLPCYLVLRKNPYCSNQRIFD